MEYLLNNTPLNWLVGPFAPMLADIEESLLDKLEILEQEEADFAAQFENIWTLAIFT